MNMQTTMRRVAAIALLVTGAAAQPVAAQSADRVELTFGAGYLAHLYSEGGSTTPSAPAPGSTRLTWSPTVSNRHVGLRASVEW